MNHFREINKRLEKLSMKFNTQQNKTPVAFSIQMNYTDRAAAVCPRI
jgi:hypothetical protein